MCHVSSVMCHHIHPEVWQLEQVHAGGGGGQTGQVRAGAGDAEGGIQVLELRDHSESYTS